MTRMTRPDCAVMYNLINIHTYIHTYVVMCNLIVAGRGVVAVCTRISSQEHVYDK